MGKLRPGHWLVPQRVAGGTERPGLYFMPVPFWGLLETPLPEEQSGLANGVFCFFFSFSFPGLGWREKGEGGEWFCTVV